MVLRNCLESQHHPVDVSASKDNTTVKNQFSLELCDLIRNHASVIYKALEKTGKESEGSQKRCCEVTHQVALGLNWHNDDQPRKPFNFSLSYSQGCRSGTDNSSKRWYKATIWVVEGPASGK
jgi:hypothetical protein